jgi:hypothetical protein
MNSVSSRVQAADFLEQNCLDGKPSATLKKNRTAKKLSDSELPTVFWMPPLSSETSESLSETVTPQVIREWLMSSQEASPARTLVVPGMEMGLKEKEVKSVTIKDDKGVIILKVLHRKGGFYDIIKRHDFSGDIDIRDDDNCKVTILEKRIGLDSRNS